jgi:hypothetical protein
MDSGREWGRNRSDLMGNGIVLGNGSGGVDKDDMMNWG